MRKFWVGLTVLGAAVNGAGLGALADTDTTSLSSTSVQDVRHSLLDRLTFTYWANYNGPSVGDFSSFQNNADGTSAKGNLGMAQNFDVFLIGGYKLTPDVSLGPIVEFHYRPVLGSDVTLNDAGVRLVNSHFIKIGSFNDSGDIRVLGPAQTSHRDINMVGAIESVHNMTYEVPHTKMTLGLYTFLEAWAYTSYMDGQQSMRYYAAPNMAYALSSNVQFTVWNDLFSLRHFRGSSGFANDPIDVEPGINWDVTPYLSVNPYLNIYSGKPTLSASYIGCILTGKVL